MKLATFTDGDGARIGIVVGELVIDLSAAAPDLPTEMTAFLAAGEAAMARALEVQDDADHALPIDNVELLAPVPRPGKILAIGLNYADHIAETGAQTPTTQIWFNKQTTATNAPYAGITKPSVSDRVDYEGELVFVIGKRAKHVPVERASEVIAGYCCGNDVSVRDWQAAFQDHADGQVVRYARTLRPVDRDARRSGRPAHAGPTHLRQRREAPGFEHAPPGCSTVSNRSRT